MMNELNGDTPTQAKREYANSLNKLFKRFTDASPITQSKLLKRMSKYLAQRKTSRAGAIAKANAAAAKALKGTGFRLKRTCLQK